ncbi:MAG: hypothetical protein BGO45_13340 [Microbacterium sp. 71-36]|uniref:Ig domain-containing protein n=1 Tax=unclassified Microbacterium TaxID=2609290 RepID=UPI00086CAAB1|nr:MULTISPECIES: Ig domain-containing protein [unclassified Microbacterium]MBN9213003.1 putative Ig domain-containing protein [Microbacterium sp.]ODT36253.1 MAG: hypothetical protein ABS60_16295 [Microbacterium sp. SCN 71-17]OJV77714.1 MAG: hypothetical protein BGO45_13340 [Microbacterium sp. 71-36]
MNIKKFGSIVAAATAISLLAGGVSATAANAATPAPQFYLMDGGDGSRLPDGKVMAWDDQVIASPGPEFADIDTPFVGQSDATSVGYFITTPGTENTLASWTATADGGFTPGTHNILQPNLSLSGFIGGNWASIKANGGTYSLGFAWVKNNGLTIANSGVKFVTITVQPGGAWTFANQAPVASNPPVVASAPLNTLTKGAAFSQTISATGTAPITWAVTAGALPAGLTLEASTGKISGTPSAAGAYGFTLTATNADGSDDQAFSGSVLDVAPVEPSGSDANKVTIPAPAEGATTVTVPAGAANANKTLQAWAWSDPTNLGQVTTDANGDATVDVSSLPSGTTHTIALTQPGDSTFAILAWGTVTLAGKAPATDDVDLKAAVTASDLWSLNAEKTQVDFGNVARDQSATKALGKVTVVDDRNVLKGWNLGASWTAFSNGSGDEIPTSALTLAPKAYQGYTLIDGVTLGSGTTIAQSSAVSTLPTGALFDADLTFKAPKDAKVGEYHSTLTVTLTSK